MTYSPRSLAKPLSRVCRQNLPVDSNRIRHRLKISWDQASTGPNDAVVSRMPSRDWPTYGFGFAPVTGFSTNMPSGGNVNETCWF